MRLGKEVCHHVAEVGHRDGRQPGAAVGDDRSPVRAANELDHHKRVALTGHILAEILQRSRMRDLLRNGGVAEEAPPHARVSREAAVEHLHRYLHTAPIGAEVDPRHASFTDERIEPVGIKHRPEARVDRRFAPLRGLPAGAEPVRSRLHHQLPPDAQSSLRETNGSTNSHPCASTRARRYRWYRIRRAFLHHAIADFWRNVGVAIMPTFSGLSTNC